ncbi:MAG: hypothetical protein LLF75_11385 [Eubacteriales bacterium]|nr:hypothetical protein [Eubacteriales bacterium]
MKHTKMITLLSLLVVFLWSASCSLPKTDSGVVDTAAVAANVPDPIGNALQAAQEPAVQTPEPTVLPEEKATAAPTAESILQTEPDGKGIVQFTVVLHLEGWDDGEKEISFRKHAEQLRAYAALFERYGAKMTLESKEIIDGCINWEDNVLLELSERGHAVGIHADAGGEPGASVRSIAKTLNEMREKLSSLGIETNFASGTASKANWVKACKQGGIDTVSCMVAYGLWSLNPSLRPDGFEPYQNPSDGHAPYPFALEDRVQPWLMADGSNWIVPDPDGTVLLIPSGLSLNGASEELNGERVHESELTQADIDAWREVLPRVIAASDSKGVNTFYAVWSFGKALDMDLLEEWLRLINEYVQAGSIRWSTIPQMAEFYRNSPER